ncbi:sigma-70 family RNA polymerase sigma factor [Cellulomonas dongxiuzhuiae]|uniref:sigma-70 family RNA polymerase sigma factor n=1 Tax=Cellulomonas dongxiuzhuiae TaxID=2819979 RepID=UPI001AAFF34C|nr:sigma-70 family RNA polymerase sigma factor [Cellulomonas dongxiuzhuiae]MBO3089133.1 sigma-70 family RNA polymerase sigma factor [Cellulomonas dongxiuzhuiae]
MARPWERLLEQLVHERYGTLVGWATLVCGSREDAQDLLQDALVATFSSRARFTTLPEAEQYVRRAVATRSIDAARRRGRERVAIGTVAGYAAAPAPGVEGHHLPADVVRALAGLTQRERACVVLRHLEDLSVRETAGLLGISEGAVKRYTSDGVAQLDAVLGGVTVESHDAMTVQPLRRAGAPTEVTER